MWANDNNNNHSGGRFRGGGRGRNSSGGRGGRSFGRGSYDRPNANNDKNTEPAVYDICKFYIRSGNCRNGDNCRFVHSMVVVAFTIQAHNSPIKTVGVLNMPDGPKLLTGSTDSSVKVWNLSTDVPTMDAAIPATGKVEHIDVTGNTIMWSVDEPLNTDQSDLTVGMVYLFNQNAGTSVAIKRSDDLPYTHSFGPIRSFTVAVSDGVTYVVTAGGDGNIRTWRLDSASGKFEHLALLEGHVRAVTCLLLNESYLWSGSVDRTLRVWEVGSGKCLGVLSATGGGNGHKDAVSCLEFIPAVPGGASSDAYIASGGGDGDVKLWKTNGEYVHTCSHASFVTSLRTFQDSLGGVQVLLVGLLDGNIVLRSCASMNILFTLDNSICHTKAVWSITSLGQSCFATGGDDGNLIVWRVEQALLDKQ